MLFSQSSCLLCYFSRNCFRNPNSTCIFRSTIVLSRLSTIYSDWHNSHPTWTSTDLITMVVDGGSRRWRSNKVDLNSSTNLTKTPLFHPFPKSSSSRLAGDHEISNEDPLESRFLPSLLVSTEIDLTCWKSNLIDLIPWCFQLMAGSLVTILQLMEIESSRVEPKPNTTQLVYTPKLYCWKWLFSI